MGVLFYPHLIALWHPRGRRPRGFFIPPLENRPAGDGGVTSLDSYAYGGTEGAPHGYPITMIPLLATHVKLYIAHKGILHIPCGYSAPPITLILPPSGRWEHLRPLRGQRRSRMGHIVGTPHSRDRTTDTSCPSLTVCGTTCGHMRLRFPTFVPQLSISRPTYGLLALIGPYSRPSAPLLSTYRTLRAHIYPNIDPYTSHLDLDPYTKWPTLGHMGGSLDPPLWVPRAAPCAIITGPHRAARGAVIRPLSRVNIARLMTAHWALNRRTVGPHMHPKAACDGGPLDPRSPTRLHGPFCALIRPSWGSTGPTASSTG